MPISSRSGKSRSRVASSIAVSATLRSGTGSRPIPTRTRDVQASAAAAVLMPPSRKQSSHSHSMSTPDASAASATARNCSGGICVRNTTPSNGTVYPRSLIVSNTLAPKGHPVAGPYGLEHLLQDAGARDGVGNGRAERLAAGDRAQEVGRLDHLQVVVAHRDAGARLERAEFAVARPDVHGLDALVQ